MGLPVPREKTKNIFHQRRAAGCIECLFRLLALWIGYLWFIFSPRLLSYLLLTTGKCYSKAMGVGALGCEACNGFLLLHGRPLCDLASLGALLRASPPRMGKSAEWSFLCFHWNSSFSPLGSCSSFPWVGPRGHCPCVFGSFRLSHWAGFFAAGISR